jgi:ribokinase
MLDILVVGSLNADLVVRVPRFPAPGETISGGDLLTLPGGKGANQAVAAARLGGNVAMLGRVGDDQFGKMLVDNLLRFQVDVSRVLPSSSPTGTAVVVVDENGQNSIVLSAGANGTVTPQDIEMAPKAKIMLIQLEIPLESVLAAARWGKKEGMFVILNPAPAQPLPDELVATVDLIVPNEIELSLLTGLPVSDYDTAQAALRALQARGARQVIVTMGERGALALMDADSGYFVAAHSVKVVDTTAAGDAFIGGLALALARDTLFPAALEYANACGALAVTRSGAQPSLPTAAEVQQFLLSHQISGTVIS